MGEISKWADEFMFRAEKSEAAEGPKVYLLQGTPDPLGSIAAMAKMYLGEVVRYKQGVTDEERRFYLQEMQKTKLKAPLEVVDLHFMVENVTRSFTHQMVRQRTAVYAQESLRFAVKEDASEAIALPPTLAGTVGIAEWCIENGIDPQERLDVDSYEAFHRESTLQKMRLLWDNQNESDGEIYNMLVNMGMPAEEARGRLPHSIVTRLNYKTNLRNLQDHAGNRLCTQAQFEWRAVWMEILRVMRNYCTGGNCAEEFSEHGLSYDCDHWQWQGIANIFAPVCYLTGKCEFKADFDRKCSIRGRVDANQEIGRPSSEWHERWEHPTDAIGEHTDCGSGVCRKESGPVWIGAISPAEWLMDDGAAR